MLDTEDRYIGTVVGTDQVSANMMRVRLRVSGRGGHGSFVSTGLPDERLRMIFPAGGETSTASGPGTAPPRRNYTVRRWDAERSEMIIDFVVHEGGVAAAWAMTARPGRTVGLTPARGWYCPPDDVDGQLLAADMTGLPAVGRIIEELPPGARAHAIVEVIDPRDRQWFDTAGDVRYTWLVGSGNGRGPSRLPESVRTHLDPDRPGYLWFAGECEAARLARKYVRNQLGWTADRFDIIGYWRMDKEAWLTQYAPVKEDLSEILEQARRAGHRESEVLAIYDEALERAGL